MVEVRAVATADSVTATIVVAVVGPARIVVLAVVTILVVVLSVSWLVEIVGLPVVAIDAASVLKIRAMGGGRPVPVVRNRLVNLWAGSRARDSTVLSTITDNSGVVVV